jgi:predicted Zn-dependent protease
MILDSPEINGFATPGGHIFVTRGLIDCAASEDMLAGVLAHEIAHVQLKHGMMAIKEFSLEDDMRNIARQSAQKTNNAALAQRTAAFQDMVKGAAEVFRNGYSQEQEFAADALALSLLARAGYQPTGLTDVLEVLRQKQPNSRGGFYSTHPAPAERIRRAGQAPRTPGDAGGYRDDRFKRTKR